MTNEIVLIGTNGFIKIDYLRKQIEIKSANFHVIGFIDITKKTIDDFKIELKKCLDCQYDTFGKSLLVSSDKNFGIEIRFTGDNEKVYVLGMYKEIQEFENLLDFEFFSSKYEIRKMFSDIEQIENLKK